jgi:hypothetical protein
MLVANVPIILVMSPKAIAAIREYLRKLDSGAFGSGQAPKSVVDVVEDRT